MCILVQLAAEAARAERRAHRKAVKKHLLLRFDDVRCFCGFERRCLARGKDDAPVWQSSGSRVRPRPSRLRHRRPLAAASRGITRSIRYTEQLWAGAAGASGASTTYLPALPSHLLKLLPLSQLDTYAD